MSLYNYESEICNFIIAGKSYEEIAAFLRSRCVDRGASVANIRKICTELGINRRSNVHSEETIFSSVRCAVQQMNKDVISN